MEFDKVIKKRASIRNYSLKKPKPEEIIELIGAANTAPSPGNLEIVRFIIIEDKGKIHQLAQCCQQKFVSDAPYVVAICSYPQRVKRMYDKRTEKYIQHHVGAVVENFLLKATDIGLASCWVGAFTPETKDILKIPEDINLEVILPIGYPEKINKTKQKPKHSLNNRVFFESYGNKYQKPFRSSHPG